MSTLLVANDGGHIAQLHTLLRRLDIDGDPVWVTPRTAQTESLLAGEEVFWTGPCPPRDVGAVIRAARMTRPLVQRSDIRLAVSTGASLALAVLPQARRHGIHSVYIESATRLTRPSVSGAILARIPGIDVYCQSHAMVQGKWKYLASPWDLFATQPEAPPTRIRSAVVSTGTQEGYGFRRLIEGLIPVIPPDADVLWQTGSTDTSGLGIQGRDSVPAKELNEALREADVVIAHAGTGISLASLDAGKCPVLVPRRAAYGEHVDDHQSDIARELAARNLAVVRDVAELTVDDLYRAASTRISRVNEVPRLVLSDSSIGARSRRVDLQPNSA